MSFIDEKNVMASDNPNFFKIGDVVLLVSASNIEISRHENFQSISYLRDSHAMKIHTGRSSLRVNVSFPILVDRQLPQLQALVAMTRVTPFVPVQNKFLQGQIRIYDEAPEVFELNKSPDAKSIEKINKVLAGDAYTDKGEPTFLEALPMAIMGMSVTMGGDSPEIAECAMSFVYWNPLPWFGIDLQYWKDDALGGLVRDYSRYIKTKVQDRTPSNFDSTVFRWWDIKLWSELKERFAKEIEEAEAIARDKDPTQVQHSEELILSADDSEVGFDDFNNYLKFKSKTTGLDDLVEAVAQVETGTFQQNAGWDKVNDGTKAAGRYQMTAATFRGLFFEGNDTVDGVPLKDKAMEALAGSDALKDNQLRHAISRTSPGSGSLEDREFFAKWYARPEMAELQTFVTKEYLRGLMKKHNGDSVKTTLEYFMGERDSRPYRNHWEKHGTIKDWSRRDKKRLGEGSNFQNATPIEYMHRAFGVLSSDKQGYAADGSAPAIDPITFESKGSGPVPVNRKGDVLGTVVKPVISKAAHDKLRELGWEQISRKGDGSPAAHIINPLFTRTEANIIDLEAGGILDAENQVVTSITIAFQNRFASLPVQGWPYPTLQHMGAMDSELRMTIACLSDSQQYNRAQQMQGMLHTMSSRARQYHSDVHDAREILKLSQIGCTNRLINSLGINDIVMTDLQIQVDPESTNMARVEVLMSESAFDPNKEKLTATLGKNDRRFRVGLREDWLTKEKYLSSKNESVRNMGTRLRALQKQNDASLAANLDILTESGQLERVVADALTSDDDFRKMVIFTRGDDADLRKKQSEITEFTDIATNRGLRMKSALYISPTNRVLNTMELHPVQEYERQSTVIVPINPSLLFTDSLSTKVGNFLEFLYKANETIPGDPHDIDRIKGDAAIFLSTSFGLDMLEVWGNLQSQPTVDEFQDYMAEFFNLLVKALHEWYNREILEAMLVLLYHRNEGDSTFAELVARSRDIPGAGIYKDLLLDQTPDLNPYSWLDESIEPQVRSAMEDVVRAAEKNTAVLVQEYNNMQRDRDQPIRFNPNAITSDAVEQDVTNSVKFDRTDGERRYRSGIKAALDRCDIDANNAAMSLREFSAVPFTMRRAFPAYRMYFIEEDNQGLVKRFDDFYNYNAITDIQIVKYKDRPTTMIVTMTNLFGNLDARTFTDMADKEELADAIRSNANGGTLPSIVRSKGPGGENETVEADGSVGPLREIMLKPGTKIVMKLGYDNNPDNLPTTFAGQVTEVSGGSVMTIVCQDWAGELLAGLAHDAKVVSSGGLINYGKYLFGFSETRDLQNTSSTRAALGSILTSRTLTHFGHWQVDKKGLDPNYFGYRKESVWITKPWDNTFMRDILRIFTGDQIEHKTRALINIHPEPQPFYTAFGNTTKASNPTKEAWHTQSFWELIRDYRRLSPNHIAMVRPYGQGDATLYFGPPWGVYVADEFNGEIGQTLVEDNDLLYKEVFRNMIRHNATMRISAVDRIGNNRLDINSVSARFAQDLVGSKLGMNAGNSSADNEYPIAFILELFFDTLAAEADVDRGTNALAAGAAQVASTPWYLQNPMNTLAAGAAGFFSSSNVGGEKGSRRINRNEYPMLHSGSTDAIIDKWYDLLMNAARDMHDDEDAHAILINLQSKIRRVQGAMLWLRSRDEIGFDPQGKLRKALKPVRQWHVVTAKHHIIANNIQVNNNFANEIKYKDKSPVRYDAELTERRTRFADREVPTWADGNPDRSIYMSSLLAEEMRTMYRGQLVLTGNAEIDPHDIIVIFDETRHMHGAIEVAKVNHIFNQEMGFITIVEPHLIVEQADYSLSTALTAFISSMISDIKENEETPAGAITNRALGGATVYAGTRMRLLLGGVTTSLLASYIITQGIAHDARNHPITIFPLIKRNAPWVAGIEGASGRGVVGVIAGKVIKTLKSVNKVITAFTELYDEVEEAAKVIPKATDVGSNHHDDPKLGRYD
jgi:hypothetical protein